jgi:hypothetical protein
MDWDHRESWREWVGKGWPPPDGAKERADKSGTPGSTTGSGRIQRRLWRLLMKGRTVNPSTMKGQMDVPAFVDAWVSAKEHDVDFFAG